MTVPILVVAPHPDDEVLGVGGTIAKHSILGNKVVVLTVSAHMPPIYSTGAHTQSLAEADAAHKILGVRESFNFDIPATTVSTTPPNELNNQIYEIIDRIRPKLVFCPFPDRHTDHRAVFESVMVATRPKNDAGSSIEILAAYEVLSSTHWNAPHIEQTFSPNWFVDISGQIDLKTDSLNCFESQIGESPDPRSVEAVRALAKFRGSQAGFEYAEAFHIIRKCN